MVKITYIEHDGSEHIVDVEVGLSLMEGAVNNAIPGIDADCGGGCACATCMIFIDKECKEKIRDMIYSIIDHCVVDYCYDYDYVHY